MRRIGFVFVAAYASLVVFASASEAPWERYRGELPPPIVPEDNPWTEAKFELGRRLFFDRRLSANGTISCASCHRPELAFTDARARSPGAFGQLTHRNSQGLVNTAWHPTLTWANPALVTIERQMEVPLFGDDPVEMGITDANRGEIIARLRADPHYPAAFVRAFPAPGMATATDAMDLDRVIKAIATFVRGIVSAESRFDRFQRGELELTAAERRGKDLFFGEVAECHHCHGSFNFNDQVAWRGTRTIDLPFHNTGLYDIDGRGGFPEPNRGVFESTGLASDMGAFRAPSLRNVAVTAPYMHDGSIATLGEVIDFYAAGGRNIATGPLAGDGRRNPHRSDLVGSIRLTQKQKRDLIAFLQSLTDDSLLRSQRFRDKTTARSTP